MGFQGNAALPKHITAATDLSQLAGLAFQRLSSEHACSIVVSPRC